MRRSRHHFFRRRRRLRQPGRRRAGARRRFKAPPPQHCPLDQVWRSDGRRSLLCRRLAPLLDGRPRRKPSPPSDRLRRPLLHPLPRPEKANFETISHLETFALEHGHTLIELALGWLASKPFVSSIIAGATRPEQVEENARSLGWRLSAEEIAAVDEIAG